VTGGASTTPPAAKQLRETIARTLPGIDITQPLPASVFELE